ncbi:MAG: DUF507 family protein [Nitrospirae bacterium]|nr:MAG: DUF507 family protein [Nitrospirota bacterium]
MMLSDEKITHMSHILFRELKNRDLIEVLEDEGKIRRQIKRSIIEELKLGEEIDQAVRKKISSMSKRPVEGSPEWEVLYKKFFKEEEKRRGRES